ncbi:hypothetical protein CASFOL_026628 [Castilleja foliolosa]|uniref:Phytocyanin domain-containing protein n=1 Tax=Castilleja foliolosa TaxID=1961234 RepID=A0ABD3CHP0_9LAMI
MEGLKRGIVLAAVALMFAAAMLPEVAAVRYQVGNNGLGGWTGGVNYTNWTHGKHFYNGDWLFFVYDRNQLTVLEVNRSGYDNCTEDHPIHNWTTGAGRDVVPLNVTRDYYFISGKGFCFSGAKLAVHVENPPPPPSSSPTTNSSPASLMSNFRGRVFVPTLFAVAAVWDSLLMLL